MTDVTITGSEEPSLGLTGSRLRRPGVAAHVASRRIELASPAALMAGTATKHDPP